MLSIIDARTGEPVTAAPARRGLTRVEAHASGHDTGELRVLLVADLLVRALELGGTPVVALLTGERARAELRTAGAALGIRPFEQGRDLAAGMGAAQTLHVVREDGEAPEGVLIAVGPVFPETPAAPARPDADPTALRLALLSHHHRDAVPLDEDALGRSHATLARWRRAVADWARQPSRPVPDEVRGRLHTAWEDDLDVPEVLRVLRSVEEAGPDLPAGARFETYAYADRLLGLELTRDVGGVA
ncbi:hypothetical protein ACIBBD_05885 [Streptomyces sp. NPDC051315]|uniref:hypothetical protein n=1 Tax=Streptomyces sp. NPDC051315 TaxID=3365650 RepID=UPI003787DD1A